ncbi:MAG: GNAT family N-acetyltransferase [Bacteroidetes bacterium]|nr:GNAT family N-acetyltransferase [Bacteroidota bacterium]
MHHLIIKTERLLLRPFNLNDAKRVQQLAGDKRISDTTLFIPHPYPDGAAEEWISTHKEKAESGNEYVFAITLKDQNDIIGAIGLVVNKTFNNAEAGYWIGVPYWNNGYVTEALASVIKFAFTELNLNKVHAHYMASNIASGKAMIKNGMQKEGYFRKHIFRNNEYHDAIFYGILREEYLANDKK